MEYLIGIFFLAIVGLLGLAIWKMRKADADSFAEMRAKQETEELVNPSVFLKDNDQVWIDYMGISFPLYRFELPRWTCLTVDEKQKWVKQLKNDIKDGKKIPIKENGKVVAYKVKDKKTIVNENLRTEIYKKANNL